MKIKKRKSRSAVALLRKRKKFGGIFLKRCILMLVVAAIVFVAGKDYFVEYEQNLWKSWAYSSREAIIEAIDEGMRDGESYEFYINRVEMAMTLRQETRTASLLFNAETGEIIADCKEQIFMFRHVGEEESYIYTCPTSDIEGWEDYREEYVVNEKEFVGKRSDIYDLTEKLEMEHIYINGEHFLPGAFTVTNKAVNYQTEELFKTFTTEFDEPEDLTSDYVKTELDDEWTLTLVYGYNENDTTAYSGSYEGYQYLQARYQNFLENGKNYLGGESYTEDKMIISATRDVTMPTGEKAILMTVYYYDVWENYGTNIIFAGILTFLAALVIAFIWAKLVHMKLKAQYDMEDYRKTLMNTMAHDLKSPLMSISGYAENLQNNLNTDKKEYYAEAILGNVDYMNRIIESVLTLGKTENVGIVLKKEKTDMLHLIEACGKKYDLQKEAKKLTINITGDGVLDIDVSLFSQAIDNLLGNAVKYASEDSAINVTISKNEISIVNQCDDMPDVPVNSLYEPFVVGNENRSDKKGSGLGLAIVNNICTLHKFKFEIKCEEKTFTAKVLFK